MAEFGKMNRIQQEAYAKALGMTKDQLAKVAYNKALELGMSEEQAEAAAGVEASDMRRMAVQEKMALVMDKIFQAFAPLLDVLELILDPLAKMLAVVGGVVGFVVKFLDKTKLLLPLILIMTAAFAGKAIASFFGTAVKGSMELFNSMKKLTAGGLLDKIKTLGAGMKDAFNTAKGGGVGDMIKSKSGKLFSKDSPQGKMIENLSGKAQDKAGSIAKTISGPKVPETAGGGASSVTDSVQKINPAKLLAGAAALVIAAGAMFILGKAMQQFQGIGMETYLGAGAALLGLSLALAGLSMLSGPVLLGAGALLVGAAAIFVLGKALQEVGKALPIMAEGMGLIFPMLTGLAQAIMPLLLLGPALFGIAAGLGAVSIAGLLALPAIGGLVLLSKAAPALVSLGIGGESKSAGEAKGKAEEGSLAGVEAKLDALVAAVKAGGNVYMDSNKVGKAQVLSTSKTR